MERSSVVSRVIREFYGRIVKYFSQDNVRSVGDSKRTLPVIKIKNNKKKSALRHLRDVITNSGAYLKFTD